MKKLLKSSLSLILAITLVLSSVYVGLGEVDFSGLLAVKANAVESGTCGDNLTWIIDGKGTLTISGTGAMYDYTTNELHLNDPGAFVENPAPWYGNSSVKSVVIGEGVTSIGAEAFVSTHIQTIAFPSTLKRVGYCAFYESTWLESVYISDIASWSAISFNDGYASPLYYADNLYLNGELVTEVSLPDGTTKISDRQFSGTSITSIVIPDSVTSIGSYAFEGCENLKSVVIGNGVTEIGKYAFYNCSNLETVVFGNKVSVVDSGVFSNCNNLTDLYISDLESWCNINFEWFYANPMRVAKNIYINGQLTTEIVIPDVITAIKDYAFDGATSITSVTIPDSVKSIGQKAFNECTGISTLTIGKGVESIGPSAFYYCKGLTKINWNAKSVADFTSTDFMKAGVNTSGVDVVFGESVEKIPAYLFYMSSAGYKPNIKSVVIEEGVEKIGSNAFAECETLCSVTIADSVRSIGAAAFYNTGVYLDSANWENGVLYISNHLIDTEATVSSNYVIKDGTITLADESFISKVNLKTITFPDSLKAIGGNTFYGCTGLTSVSIPEGVSVIGESAFYGCSNIKSVYVTNFAKWLGISFGDEYANPLYYATDLYVNGELIGDVVIPDGVKTIPTYAFSCTGIKSINIPDSVESIGAKAFEGCDDLAAVYISDVASWCNISFDGSKSNPLYYADSLYVNGELVSEIIVPEGVKTIPTYAFGCSNLKVITIPESVTSVENTAFRGCTMLEKIYWNAKSVTDFIDSSALLSGAGVDGTGIEIVFGDTVQKIPAYLCYVSDSASKPLVKSVVIGKGVTSIGAYAFAECVNLESIVWNARAVNNFTKTSDVLYNSGTSGEGVSITFGDSVKKIPAYLCYASNSSYKPLVTSVTVGVGVTNIGDYAFHSCANLKEFSMPDSIKVVGNYAFQGCVNLSVVTFSKNLETIGNYAFCNCTRLKSVVIPDSVTTIGNGAFSYCYYYFKEVTIPSGVTSIGAEAFANCTHLQKVTWNAESIADFTSTSQVFRKAGTVGNGIDLVLGDNVKKIPAYLTYVTNTSDSAVIKSVTVGNRVSSIGKYAFYNCSSISDVYYNGLESCWNKISVGTYNTKLTSAARRYASEDVIQGTDDAIVDYDNMVIRTSLQNSEDIFEFFELSENAEVITASSHKYNDAEVYGTGTVISLYEDGSLVGSFTLVVGGDTNGDSVCDVLDAAQVARVSSGKDELDGAYALAADSDENDVIDVDDYQIIVNKAVS